MKVKEFFKPTKGKIILTLIFFIPIIILIFFIFKELYLDRVFLLKFFILKKIFSFLVGIFGIFMMFFMAVQGCAGDVGDITSCGNAVNQSISFVLASIIFIIFTYFVSCFIVAGWNKLFERFGKRAKLYKAIILIFFISLFLIFSVLLPLIGHITIEKSSLPTELNKEQIFSQELTIKNNLILPVEYKLPYLTVCAYDTEKKVRPTLYGLDYKYEDGSYISHSWQSTSGSIYIIRLGAKEEKKTYIYGETTLERYERYYANGLDELLLFENIGLSNDPQYCMNITEEDRNKVEKIRVVKS